MRARRPTPPGKAEALHTRQDELNEQYGYLCRDFERAYEKLERHFRPITKRKVPGAKRLGERAEGQFRAFHKAVHSNLRIFHEVARYLLEQQHQGDMQIMESELRKALDEIDRKSTEIPDNNKQ